MCFSFVCCVFQILVQDPNEGLSINSSRTGFIFAGFIYDSLGFEVLCECLNSDSYIIFIWVLHQIVQTSEKNEINSH